MIYQPTASIYCIFLNKLLKAPLNCVTYEKLLTNMGIERDVILSACEWHTGMTPAGRGDCRYI